MEKREEAVTAWDKNSELALFVIFDCNWLS